MKLKTTILLVVLLVIIGCKQRKNKKEDVTNSKTEIVQPDRVPENHIDWVDAINSNNINALENSYQTNAVKIISADNIINGAQQIANYYRIRKNKITSIESIFSVKANKERGINYELVRYRTDNLKEYIEIVISRMQDEKMIREFEFTQAASFESTKVDTTDIGKRRKLWIELCNANDAKNLVKELYSSNTMYFNHKPMVKGTEDLIKEYGYMNNENYTLNLRPLKLEVANENFAFEIGQCSGSYNGKYILVWKKQADGNWNIYIDSNI